MGAGATQPSSNYSPGLPLFVAGLYEVTGGVHERLARVVLAVIGALSVLFAYLIGRRLAGTQRPRQVRSLECPPGPRLVSYAGDRRLNVWPALVGALVVAIYPALLEYQGMLMSEPLAATLLSGGVLAVLWAWEGGWCAVASCRERCSGRWRWCGRSTSGVAVLVALVSSRRGGCLAIGAPSLLRCCCFPRRGCW